ncbi:MAG: DUF2059 domain-containing protein [Deltaproteobacteria bacterium]|nr:DUF2059 domain-containing protein [Deltaproteobacteria bacterium]
MKSLLLLLVLVLAAACTEQKATQTGAPVADNEENRLAAAKEYLKIAPAQDILKEMAASFAGKLPEQVQKKFNEVMASKDLQDNTYQITLKALVKQFTANELKAMTAFYSSPEGKSIRQKLGPYMAEVMPQVYQEVAKAMKAAEPQAAPESKATPAPHPTPGPQAAPESKAAPVPQAAPETKAQPAPPSPKPGTPPPR